MPIRKLQRSTYLFIFSLLIIVSADIFVTHRDPFQTGAPSSLMGYALLMDFMLVVPFLYWLLILRKNGKSLFRTLPYIGLGAVLAWLALPSSLKPLIAGESSPLKAVITGLEVCLFIFEATLVYRLVKRFRQHSRLQPDTTLAIRHTITAQMGNSPFSKFVLHDLLVAYYLLFSWKKRNVTAAASASEMHSFTYHKKTSLILYAAILTHVIAFEGIAMHFLVQQWSELGAWLLNIGDLWILSLIWADCRAASLQPVRIEEDVLHIRYGLRIQASIPVSSIQEVSSALEFHPEKEEVKQAAMPMLTPNVRITLKHPIQVETILLLTRQVHTIYLALDDPVAFAYSIEQKCFHNNSE